MSWEARTDCRSQYYTRSRRVGGRIVREYVGIGPVAELAATMDEAERADRAAKRAALIEERTAIAAARAASGQLGREARALVHEAMTAAGFHFHGRSSWRRCRMSKDTPNEIDPDADPLRPPGAGPEPEGPTTEELWAFLHGKPPPPRRTGPGLARQAETAWATLIAGPDSAVREAVDVKLSEFRAALGADGSPLEQMLCEQAGVAWLESMYFSTRAADSLGEESTDAHRDFLARNADRAARKLAFLTKQLIAVRRLLQPRAGSNRPAGAGAVKPPGGGRKRRHNPGPARSGG